MNRDQVSEFEVTSANKTFYDTVGEDYERIDGRRSNTLETWISENLMGIRALAGGGRLLDVGTGSGLVLRCAKDLFSLRVGLDLSTRLLAIGRQSMDAGIAANVNALPFADDSFDVISSFAVIHHLYALEEVVSEFARVLKPGGVFYVEHDMDMAFNKRFAIPLLLYRALKNNRKKYCDCGYKISRELYSLTEWQETGVDYGHLESLLQKAGFSLQTRFHWFGLNPLTDKIFGGKNFSRGWAPIISIIATKI